MSRLAVALLLSLAAACQLESTLGKKHAYLEIHAVPDTARVTIDDVSVGSARTLAQHPHRLAPGTHFVEVEAKGYFPHDLKLDLPQGVTKVDIALRPRPR